MKSTISLLILFFLCCMGCQEKADSPFVLPWEQVKQKGIGAHLNIIVEQTDEQDITILKRMFDEVSDSFKINIRYRLKPANKIADILLADSKLDKKSKYDLVIASDEVMSELNTLGLLYANYHSSIPNFSNLNLRAKQILTKRNQHGLFLVPVTMRCPGVVYDTTVHQNIPLPGVDMYPYIYKCNSAFNLSLLVAKRIGQNRMPALDSIDYLSLLEGKSDRDSLTSYLKQYILPIDSIKPGMNKLVLMSPFNFDLLKSKGSLNIYENADIPCMNTCAGILNSSNSVFGAMLLINNFLDENTQHINFEMSHHYFRPVVRINNI